MKHGSPIGSYKYLTVIEPTKLRKCKFVMWRCVCKCGTEVFVRARHAINGGSCGCARIRPKGAANPLWKGHEGISYTRWNKIKREAARRGLTFSLEIGYLWNLFLSQNSLCALTGIPLSLGSFKKDKESNASLDRIDSSIGYEVGNVQWVHKTLNVMKQGMSQQEFIRLCSLVHSNNAGLVQ